jgi:hypothetical protein
MTTRCDDIAELQLRSAPLRQTLDSATDLVDDKMKRIQPMEVSMDYLSAVRPDLC